MSSGWGQGGPSMGRPESADGNAGPNIGVGSKRPLDGGLGSSPTETAAARAPPEKRQRVPALARCVKASLLAFLEKWTNVQPPSSMASPHSIGIVTSNSSPLMLKFSVLLASTPPEALALAFLKALAALCLQGLPTSDPLRALLRFLEDSPPLLPSSNRGRFQCPHTSPKVIHSSVSPRSAP